MKKRDSLLFSLPLVATVLIAAFAAFLYWQIAKFEEGYLFDAKNNIAQEAQLAAAVITPMLQNNDFAQIKQFCDSVKGHTLRLTLIDDTGKVVADTKENSGIFDNHKDRSEVKKALEGEASSTIRYSSSLNQKMIYHAMPVDCNGKRYVLRSAIPTAEVGRIIDISRLNMFWALLFGAEIVLFLTIYIVKAVRKPLINLQQSVEDIADGNLDKVIEIPPDGIIRDLAIDIAKMTEQLKNQLTQVTFERNEREALFNTMSEGVLLFQSDGFLIRANNAAAELLKFDRNKSFHLNRCHIPELVEEAQKTIKSEESFEKEFFFDRNGQNISLWIKGAVLYKSGEKRLLLTVTDLTNLRKLESFRADFIANVSHEIKTPLTCISGAAEALEETGNPENRAKLTAMLKKHTERLNNLVKDILNLARLEKSPRKESTSEKIVLSSVVDNVIDIETDHAKECGFELKVADNLPLTVSGDADLLEQALINLVENALRYSNGKNITLSVTQEGANAILTVKDDGIGIAPEHHDRLFERFYRVDKSRSRELGGTGLGLAIVKHIALIHNGKAEISNKPDAGAEFRIILPL